MPKHAHGVHHREQLEDMRRVSLLGGRQLAALVRHGMVVAVIIRLCKHGRDGHLASIRGDDGSAPRVEGAEDGGLRQALLQRFRALLFGVAPVSGGLRATQPCKWGGNVSVAVDEVVVVVAQPHEAAQLDIGWRDRPISHGRDLAQVRCHPRCRELIAKPGKEA